MQVGILDRKNERLPSFLFIMTKNKLCRRDGKSPKRLLHPGKTENLFVKNEEITGENRKRTGRRSLFCKKSCKAACIAGEKAIQ